MALTRCAAAEAAPAGVRVNAVSPSLAEHPFLNRVIPDEDLAVLRRRELFGRGRRDLGGGQRHRLPGQRLLLLHDRRGRLREQPAPVSGGIGGAPAPTQEDPRADLTLGRRCPGLVEDAARRHGDAEALVDGDAAPDLRASWRPEVDRYARGFVAAGRRRGGPGRHLGAQLRRVDARRARRAAAPGPSWCRSTPGSRAARRPTSCATSGATTLLTVRGFLGHRLPGHARRARTPATLERHRPAARRGRRGAAGPAAGVPVDRPGRVPRPRASGVDPADDRGAGRGGAARTTSPTSSSPRARPATPRGR